MRDKYSQHLVIPCYDTDASQLLKPSSFMNLAQEAANLHANILGFGYDNLIEMRTAWVLSRMHIHFVRHPKWRDEVDFTTWHKGPERLFYIRDFLMSDSQGNALVTATTSWLVLNIDTRRIVRDAGISTEDICLENAIEQPCDKVQMPAGVQREKVCRHVVSYSDVDLNGHTNNAMYLVWAMDALEYATASKSPVRDVRINFNHETRPGETVEIYRYGSGDGLVWSVEGEVGGRSAFCAEITF